MGAIGEVVAERFLNDFVIDSINTHNLWEQTQPKRCRLQFGAKRCAVKRALLGSPIVSLFFSPLNPQHEWLQQHITAPSSAHRKSPLSAADFTLFVVLIAKPHLRHLAVLHHGSLAALNHRYRLRFSNKSR